MFVSREVREQINMPIRTISFMSIFILFFGGANAITQLNPFCIICHGLFLEIFMNNFSERDKLVGHYNVITYEPKNKLELGEHIMFILIIMYIINFASWMTTHVEYFMANVFICVILIFDCIILLLYRNHYILVQDENIHYTSILGKTSYVKRTQLRKIYFDKICKQYIVYSENDIQLFYFGKNMVNFDEFLQEITEIIAFNKAENEGYIMAPSLEELLEKEKPKRKSYNN